MKPQAATEPSTMKGTTPLAFEADLLILVSHCSGVGNHCFSGRVFTNRTDRLYIDVEPTLPIVLPNCYQNSAVPRRG